jgi:Cu+-exporting ATPase
MTIQSQYPPHTGEPQGELQPLPAEACQTTLALEGMTCASCAMRIEKGLKKVPGVLNASVNLATERGFVTYDPSQTGIEQLVQKVEAIGYKANPQLASQNAPAETPKQVDTAEIPGVPPSGLVQEDEQSARKRKEIKRKRNLLLLGIVLTLPVVILSMFFMKRFPGENLLLLALTTPVWAIVGWEFHRGALKTLRHASANMDTLVSIGSTAAYVMSWWCAPARRFPSTGSCSPASPRSTSP